nr:uncharacterized protein LOC127323494 [Lolium perenne]XP_051208310.1 uncharacterized protein LOC127325559 [Lolium perenne]
MSAPLAARRRSASAPSTTFPSRIQSRPHAEPLPAAGDATRPGSGDHPPGSGWSWGAAARRRCAPHPPHPRLDAPAAATAEAESGAADGDHVDLTRHDPPAARPRRGRPASGDGRRPLRPRPGGALPPTKLKNKSGCMIEVGVITGSVAIMQDFMFCKPHDQDSLAPAGYK